MYTLKIFTCERNYEDKIEQKAEFQQRRKGKIERKKYLYYNYMAGNIFFSYKIEVTPYININMFYYLMYCKCEYFCSHVTLKTYLQQNFK